MGGAFQTSREIFDNPIWKNIVEFRLFFLIYGNAVFSDEGVRLADDLILQRGEWCRSTRKIQEDLTYIENRQVKTYSTSVINRCIKKLEQSQRICTRIHELGTVFTVLNYEQYQGFSNYGLGNLERNLEHSGNSGRTVEEQSGNNNKNVKNANKVKNEKIKEPKIQYSQNVSMTETEHSKLQEELGENLTQSCILYLAAYKIEKGYKTKSDYLTIKRWVIDAVRKSKTIPFRERGGNHDAKHGTGHAGRSDAELDAMSF